MARTVALSNGVEIPRVGFGTFKAKGDECKAAVLAALRAGTRHIDTASIYKNEEAVGQAVRESGLERSEIFVTSKVSPYEQGTSKAAKAVENILGRLDLGYVDLLLIHWPGVSRVPHDDPKVREMRLETWRVLEGHVKKGTVRAIGVSNYEERHLRELVREADIKPAVNQFECHPRLPQSALRGACVELGVVPVAYASLGCGDLLGNPVVVDVANTEGRTPAQVLLQWGLQRGCCVIPKSVRVERIKEMSESNLLGWNLSASSLDALDLLDDGHKYCWDPSSII